MLQEEYIDLHIIYNRIWWVNKIKMINSIELGRIGIDFIFKISWESNRQIHFWQYFQKIQFCELYFIFRHQVTLHFLLPRVWLDVSSILKVKIDDKKKGSLPV